MNVVKALKEQPNFKVVCSWCEAIIRRTSVKESRGMCLACYTRMLQNRQHNRQPSRKSIHASER